MIALALGIVFTGAAVSEAAVTSQAPGIQQGCEDRLNYLHGLNYTNAMIRCELEILASHCNANAFPGANFNVIRRLVENRCKFPLGYNYGVVVYPESQVLN